MKRQIFSWITRWRWIISLKETIDHGEIFLFELKMEGIYLWRQIFGRSIARLPSLHFAIVCVKRTVYCDFALRQINSLHLHAPWHVVTIYADTHCFNYLRSQLGRAHYPDKVHVELLSTQSSDPWQFSKIECLVRASKAGQILMDADGIWRAAPIVNRKKIVLLVSAYPFVHNHTEASIVRKTSRIDVDRSLHFVTGFVSIPKQLMTNAFADRLRTLTRDIFKKSHMIKNQEERARIRRLSEEIAISVAVQELYPSHLIATLKKTDGPNDRNSLQSLYYGCLHQIDQ